MKTKYFISLISFLFFSLFCFSTLSFAEEEKKESVSSQLIIVNKAKNKLAFYEDGHLVNVFSVATGADASSTPEGDFKVAVKWECPAYYKKHIGGCEFGNPLGKRWIGLDVPGTVGYTYGIHGNAAEWSIGTYASAGCVRMHNWQVEQLFEFVEVGAKVKIIRSSKDFDEIAKDLNYEVIQPTSLDTDAYLQNDLKGYYGLNEHLKNDSSYTKGIYKAVKQSGEYVKIENEDGSNSNWVKSSDVIVANFEKYDEKYSLVKKDSPIFNNFNDEKSNNSFLTNRVVKPILSTDKWFLIEHNNHQLWVQKDSLENSTEKEFLAQSDSNKKLFKTLVSLNNK